MKISLPAALILGSIAVLSGCSTTGSRIRENSELFASLPDADQERLRAGTVAVGDSPEMVYIAIGAPSRRQEKMTASGRSTTWVYTTHYERYEGDAFVGYQRRMAIDPRTGRRIVFLEPCYTEVYRTGSQERIRITFENERVTAIEELKR